MLYVMLPLQKGIKANGLAGRVLNTIFEYMADFSRVLDLLLSMVARVD